MQSLFIHQLNMSSEVVVAMSPGRDFHFDSTPVSAPSSPKSFGYFYDHSSAPTSPTRAAAAVYSQFNLDIADFNFSFATEAESGPAVPADELFEGGRIRPLRSSGERGRQEASSASSRSHRPSRSLSPIRGGEVYETSTSSKPPSTSSSTADIKSGGSRRWRIRDLLLFRSASEGRATGRESSDPLRKYCPLAPSTSSSSTRKGKGGLAEIHYRENRAAYEEQKKKTALPYHRNGLFGYLKFNPAINSITRGINTRVRS